jgi:hypothetical protein
LAKKPDWTGPEGTRPKSTVQLLARYNDFINPDTVVQQLLLLNEDEITIPITNNNTLQSTINLVSMADAHVYAL